MGRMRSPSEYKKKRSRGLRTEFWGSTMSRSGENKEEPAKNKGLRKCGQGGRTRKSCQVKGEFQEDVSH